MSPKLKAIVIGIFVVVLAGGGYAASLAEAKKVGEKCETYQASSCQGPGAQCLVTQGGNYCSIECKADGECPKGWSCAGVSSETYSGKTGKKVSEEEVRMCVRP